MKYQITAGAGHFSVTDTTTGQTLDGLDTVDFQFVGDGRALMQFGSYVTTATIETGDDVKPAPAPSPTPSPAPTT
jgi:hypothetical protein